MSILALDTFYIKKHNEDKYLIASNEEKPQENPNSYNVKFGIFKDATLFTFKKDKLKGFVHLVLNEFKNIALFMDNKKACAKFGIEKNDNSDTFKLIPSIEMIEVYSFKFINSKCLQHNVLKKILEYAPCDKNKTNQLFEFIDGRIEKDITNSGNKIKTDVTTSANSDPNFNESFRGLNNNVNAQNGYLQPTYSNTGIEPQLMRSLNNQRNEGNSMSTGENICKKMLRNE